RLERRLLLPSCVEREYPEPGADRRHIPERTQQIRGGRQRHLLFRLVADDPKVVGDRPRGNPRQQPALAAAGVSDDDRGGRLAPETGVGGLAKRGELPLPADEPAHLPSVRRRTGPWC